MREQREREVTTTTTDALKVDLQLDELQQQRRKGKKENSFNQQLSCDIKKSNSRTRRQYSLHQIRAELIVT